MASDPLDELIKRADGLSLDEQLRLIAHLAEKAREASQVRRPRRLWKEICGAGPYPLLGEDAQDWVSHSRRESDVQRG
jgi:hypothetical protein